MLDQAQARLRYLVEVGLGYLTLDRTLRTLSGGEAQRVALTSALGSSLVNMLYVLDEPSVGLHPRDVDRLTGAIRSLRDRGNSVVVVEHEESMIRAADQIIEIGPGAGERGGEVVFQGTPEEIARQPSQPDRRFSLRPPRRGARGHSPRAEPRLDSPGRGPGQQLAKRDGRVSAGSDVPGDRRQRIGQEHAGRRHALPGPLPPDAQGRAQAGTLRRRVRRRPVG